MSAPHWPQSMKRKTAAAYMDMTEAAFEREVAAGRLPASFMLGSREHWHKPDLDKALERIAGGQDAVPDYRKRHQERYGKAA